MSKHFNRLMWFVIAGVLLSAGAARAQLPPSPAQLDQILQDRTTFARDAFRAGPINPRTPRAIGMGEAFVAVGGSYDSMFYNPAGLGSVTEKQFSIIGVRGETNMDTIKFLKDGRDLQGDEAATNAFFRKHIGDIYYLNANNITHVVIPYQKKWVFGLAYAYTYQVDGLVSPNAPPAVIAPTNDYITAIRKLEDNAGYATAAYRVYEDFFDLGLTLKFVDRIDVRNSETPDSAAANGGVSYSKSFFKPFKGGSDFSAGSDLGFVGRLPFRILMRSDEKDEAPSPWGIKSGYIATGFTFQDVARTRFKAKTPDPANGILVSGGSDVPMTVDWGLAASVPFEAGKLTLAFDIRDINRDEIKLSQKYSLGLEFALRYVLTVRGGINANGFVGGAEVRAAACRFNAEFTQSRNTALVNNKKENRFAGGISFGWPYK